MPEHVIFALQSILDASEKIVTYAQDIPDHDALQNQPMVFDACLMNFIVIGEMVSRLEESWTSSHPQVEWSKIKSFRNIAAHDYFGIDVEEVWQIIRMRIPSLILSIKGILKDND